MSYNPHGVEVGEYVILDEDMLTAQEVKILHITKKQLFSLVRDDSNGKEWTVRTGRLFKKSPLNSKIWQSTHSK